MINNVKYQHPIDTAANWANSSRILLAGEVGYENDTGKSKVGDGIHTWSDLSYASDAEKNVIVGIQKNGSDISVNSSTRKVNITVPTKVSDLTNDSGFTSNTGTITKISTGVGLAGGDITSAGTIKAKLKSETAHTADSATPTNTSGRQYAVGVDKSEYLSVNVPWTDTKNTAGATNSSNELYLIGATSQTNNPQTYSNSNIYINNGILNCIKDIITFSYVKANGIQLGEFNDGNGCINFVGANGATIVISAPDVGVSNAWVYLPYDGGHLLTEQNYFVSDTAATTAAKTINTNSSAVSSVTDLYTGYIAMVKFTNGSNCANATLNISGTAKPIWYKGSAITANTPLQANVWYEFRYNGTQFDVVGNLIDLSNYYTKSEVDTAISNAINGVLNTSF